MLTLILFIVLLSLIIVVHEFGHLIAAKIFGVYCHEFSLGMGPKIFSIKGKETTYSLRALPLGGFVAMAGDSDNALETSVDVDVPYERTLLGVAKWKKIIVMLAGIFMNIVLAIAVIAMILLSSGGYVLSPDTTIATIAEGSPAEVVGMKEGDKVLHIDMSNGASTTPKTFDDMVAFLLNYDGNGDVTFTVLRDETEMTFTLVPEFDENTGRYIVGVGAKRSNVVEVNLGNCLYYAVDYAAYMMRTIFMSLAQLVRGVGLQNLSGPVGIYEATEQAASMGAQSYFLMLALLSLNVGIFNALPLPIMDGGRVLLTLIEMVIRRPISKKVEGALMTASMLLLMLLFVFVTYQDILRLF